jgi:hypothetical protein
MSIETEIASLTTASTELTAAVAIQQTGVDKSVADFKAAVEIFTEVSEGLSQVDNTPDSEKPVSNEAGEALAGKQNKLIDGENISTVNGRSLLGGEPLVIARGRVEIPILSYDDRAELRTPVSPIPLTGDVVNIPHVGQFQFCSTLQYLDDDEMVFQAVSPADGVTPIGQWCLNLPAYEWLEAQRMFENAVVWEWIEDEREQLNIN